MGERATGERGTTNRVFWTYVGILTVGGVLLTALIVLNRPALRSGAAREVQDNLAAVADAALRVGDGGAALQIADRYGLSDAVPDLLLIDPDQASNKPNIVSVYATPQRWVGSARAITGGCYWVRILPSGTVERGTASDCAAEVAVDLPADGWPTP